MNEVTKICLVGDKFVNFKQHKNIQTFSEFEEYLRTIYLKKIIQPIIVVIGQGISNQSISRLNTLISNLHLDDLIQVKNPVVRKEKSEQFLVHKHKIENSMISIPEQIDDNLYHSLIMLDDNCDEMNDHVTGQHIQGMILIEAARQMTLAVTEKYFIAENNRKNIAFVTNSLKTIFFSYVFPFDVTLVYTVLKYRKLLSASAKFMVLINIMQDDEVKAEIQYEFSIMDKKNHYEKEQCLAMNSVNAYLNKHSEVA